MKQAIIISAWDQVHGYFLTDINITPSSVPVPAAFWLLGSGLIGLAGLKRGWKR